ncbi:MAG: hypothetical protein ACLGIG_10780 [Actinomycetes bacterium]
MSSVRRIQRSVSSNLTRSATAVGLVGGLAGLTLAGPVGAAAATSGDTPQVINQESVEVLLDAAGEVENKRLYNQLTVLGKGTVTVQDPTASTGLRDLNGFSAPLVRDGKAQYSIEVDGREDRRTVAEFDGELPVTVKASYVLDGERVDPEDVVGKSGTLETTYTVVNRTSEPTEITYKNGRGEDVTETVDVVTPYVGRLALELPSQFKNVQAEGADDGGDGRGGTALAWTLVLFEPIGEPAQQLTWTADVTDAELPPAELQVVPVDPDGNRVIDSGLLNYGEGAEAASALTKGIFKVDGKILEVRDGAAKIFEGLTELQAGTAALKAGLQDSAAPGAQKLADGADELATGLEAAGNGSQRLADGLAAAKTGSTQLAAGLAAADAGGAELAAGLPELASGLEKIQAGLELLGNVLPTNVSDGINQLRFAVAGVAVQMYIDAGLLPGLDGLRASLDSKILPGIAGLEGALDSKVLPGITALEGAIDGRMLPGITSMKSAITGQIVPGLQAILAGAEGNEESLPCAIEALDVVIGGIAAPGRAATECLPALPEIPAAHPVSAMLLTDVRDGLQDSLDSLPAVTGGLETIIVGLSAPGTKPDGTPISVVGGLDALFYGLNTTDLHPVTKQPVGLRGGLQALYAGLDSTAIDPNTGLPAGLRGGLDALYNGIDTTAVDANGVPLGVRGALIALRAGLDHPSVLNPDGSLKRDENGDPIDPGGLRQFLLEQVDMGLAKLELGVADGLAGALGAPTDDKNSPLANTLIGGTSLLSAGADRAAVGSRKLSDGLDQLSAGGTKLDGGVGQLADGSRQLADGLPAAVDGAGQIADGAGQLADGLGDAADGSGKIDDGVIQVKDGVGQLRDGANRLSGEGSSLLAGAANDGATSTARKAALLAAMAAKAEDGAMPYGAPEGAAGDAAFSYVLAGANSDAEESTARGGAALALLALGSLSAYLVRRRITA